MNSIAISDDLHRVSQFCREFSSLVDALMAEFDISRGQAKMLYTLVENDGASQTALANLLCVQGATVTNLIKRMEKAGWIRRERDENDQRNVLVFLTEAGRDKESQIRQQWIHIEERLFAALTNAEQSQFIQLLDRMMHSIKNADEIA